MASLIGATTGGIGSIIGGLAGSLLQGISNSNQISQQQKLTAIQTKAQEELMDYQQQQQLQMWKETNYPAQVQQLIEAGLNPALLYGKGGGGGTTTGGSMPSVTGGTAQNNFGAILANGEQAAALGIQQAQIANINADTKLKETQATNISGAQTDLQKQKLTAIQTKAQEELMDYQQQQQLS